MAVPIVETDVAVFVITVPYLFQIARLLEWIQHLQNLEGSHLIDNMYKLYVEHIDIFFNIQMLNFARTLKMNGCIVNVDEESIAQQFDNYPLISIKNKCASQNTRVERNGELFNELVKLWKMFRYHIDNGTTITAQWNMGIPP